MKFAIGQAFYLWLKHPLLGPHSKFPVSLQSWNQIQFPIECSNSIARNAKRKGYIFSGGLLVFSVFSSTMSEVVMPIIARLWDTEWWGIVHLINNKTIMQCYTSYTASQVTCCVACINIVQLGPISKLKVEGKWFGPQQNIKFLYNHHLSPTLSSRSRKHTQLKISA